MAILPRYFLRLFVPVFGLCLGLFTGVLLMNHFLKLFNMALMKGISPFWIAGCFARLLPYLCSLAVPMAYIVALLVTLAQLSESGEVTALRASGFSFLEMTWPFLAVGTLASGLLLYLNHKASPDGFHAFRQRYAQAAAQVAKVDIEARALVRLGGWRLYAREVDEDSGALRGVYLVRQESRGQSMRIDARAGSLRVEKGQGAVLELSEGSIALPNAAPERFTSGKFSRYRATLPLVGTISSRKADIQELSTPRLRLAIAAPETSAQHKNEYRVEIGVRSAAALSPFVFFWIGAPLGLGLGAKGRGAGFAASLGILFGFYGMLALGISLGRRFPPIAGVAPWLGDALGLALGLRLTRRAVSQ